ncbi:MAG TPA: rhodanese-like domain-containing protein [bacterium]|nr:rhodanese-like domain-containing protein [bacterium]
MRADRHFPEIERLTVEEARSRVQAGAAAFVDVRRADAYAAGHIPGAVSAPAHLLIGRAVELPRGLDPIVY